MENLDYDSIVQKALRGVVHDVLFDTMQRGLVGNSHFYITFSTNHPWVKIPDYLRNEYPDEMVVVLQHEFEDLEVTDKGFSVTLYFDDISERISVPFSAIINFVDPSVKFGLQFIPSEGDEEDQRKSVTSVDQKVKSEEETKLSASKVISLDDFRKK
jgi:hypothetical protein